jgi:transcriptional regulator with XRE-family HTH domain
MRAKDGGAPVKRARARKRFTQRELAYLSRCSQTAIYLLENGKLPTLSDELAQRIADRLDVDVEDLFEARSSSRMAEVSRDPVPGAA